MISGIGTDIVSISRIDRALNRYGSLFMKRILTESELIVCEKRYCQASFVATRFCAKEATVKALGLGIGYVSFHDMEVLNNADGAPYLNLSGNARNIYNKYNIKGAHVSLSDEKRYAVAFVILEI